MPEVQNQGVDRVGFFWGLGENLYCALPPPCGGCQQLLACSHITPVSASVFTLPSPCHTCLSSFDVFLRPGVIGFRVGPNPQWLNFDIFTLIVATKTLIPNKVILKYLCMYLYTCTFIWLCQVLAVACRVLFPNQGWNTGPLHWERGVLATGSPAKFQRHIWGFKWIHLQGRGGFLIWEGIQGHVSSTRGNVLCKDVSVGMRACVLSTSVVSDSLRPHGL